MLGSLINYYNFTSSLCVLLLISFLLLYYLIRIHLITLDFKLKFQSIFNGSLNCITLYDKKANLISINESGLKLMGWQSKEIGKSFINMWPDDEKYHISKVVQQVLNNEKAIFESYTQRKSDNKKLYLHVVLNPLFDRKHNISGFSAIWSDITEAREKVSAQKEAERDLHVQNSAINAASDQIIIVDTNGKIIFVNKAFEDETGFTAEEVIGQNPRLIKSENQNQAFSKNMWETISKGITWRGEVTNKRKDGSSYVEDMTITPVQNSHQEIEHYIAIRRNVAHRKTYEEQLDHLAHHDSLTGLPNRLSFSDSLEQSIKLANRSSGQLAVMFIDLDNFKNINDTLGHNVGDELLKLVSERLKTCLRESDTLARMGGDEFTVILRDINPGTTAQAAKRISDSLKSPIIIGNNEMVITTSIGISVYPTDGENAQTLVKNADTAMYKAKEHGKNSYETYSESMNAAMLEKMRIEFNLRKAIEKNEFELYFQPRVDMKTSKLLGAEALIRWNHPELGFISPSDFIPVAEETGLIISVGEWVINAVCNQIMEWQNQLV